VVRTCSLWLVSEDVCGGVVGSGESTRGRKSPGRCLLTVECANRTCVVAREGSWRSREGDGQQRRRKEKSGSVCCTFGVGGSRVLVGARRIQSERIPGGLVDVTSGGLVMVVLGRVYARGIGAGSPAFEKERCSRARTKALHRRR
jgi:hypothetical protein